MLKEKLRCVNGCLILVILVPMETERMKETIPENAKEYKPHGRTEKINLKYMQNSTCRMYTTSSHHGIKFYYQ
jgi:hypothetical protein